MKSVPVKQNGWMYLLAFGILIAGGIICYLLYSNGTTSDARTAFSAVLALTIISSGILLISATADYWFRR